MKNKEKVILAATAVAGIVAFLITRKKVAPVVEEFPHFKKNRHLTPFAHIRKQQY